MSDEVYIVLPTYNGEAYLSEQISSIQTQTYQTWKLLIRDDGSSDSTVSVTRSFASLDKRIELVADDKGNLGPVGSFSLLASLAVKRGADYVSFCDQDDIWLREKLEKSISRIKNIEKQHGIEHPALVHSDLEVVTEKMEVISESYICYENLHLTERPSINRILVQNYVVGCTMLANKSLINAALPVPDGIRMHDWWLSAFAIVNGKIGFIPEATIKYRQHSGNTFGSKGFLSAFNPLSKSWYRRLNKRVDLQRATLALSKILKAKVGDVDNVQYETLLECDRCLRMSCKGIN